MPQPVATPKNNPLKLPFFLLCAGIGAFVAVVGVVAAAWPLVALGALLLLASLRLAWIVRQGRNPRWMRSPLDGRRPDEG
jgi:membrane protein implicated in regulation of membrane protease activity